MKYDRSYINNIDTISYVMSEMSDTFIKSILKANLVDL